MSKYVLRNPFIEAIKVEEPFEKVLEWCNEHAPKPDNESDTQVFTIMKDRDDLPVGIMDGRRILAEKGEYLYVDPKSSELFYMDGYEFEKDHISSPVE